MTDGTFAGDGSPGRYTSVSSAYALAYRLNELALALQQEKCPDNVLRIVVRAAVELIPGVDEGSVGVVSNGAGGRLVSHASSGPFPESIDDLQSRIGEGPSLDTIRLCRMLCVPDMSAEHRWQRFVPQAIKSGVQGMLTVHLKLANRDVGTLNLYSHRASVLTEESERIGLLLAPHAAVAFSNKRQEAHLAEALISRDRIGQAKGILMERRRITEQQAFSILVETSQHTNMKLREVADWLASTGTLPEAPNLPWRGSCRES